MKLAYWMYAGPAHIGTLRVASSFKNVHAIMHAPLGDDYGLHPLGYQNVVPLFSWLDTCSHDDAIPISPILPT